MQIHEPALVLGDANSWKEHFQTVYQSLSLVGIPVHLVTYFDDLGETYPWVIDLPVAAISLDLTRGRNLELIKTYGFPPKKRLGAGIIDARNIWQIRSEKVIPILQDIVETLHGTYLHIQPSASLQFVPYDAKREKRLPSPLRNVLSFAEQKLQEVVFLARTITGENTKAEQELIETSWSKFEEFNPANQSVQERS